MKQFSPWSQGSPCSPSSPCMLSQSQTHLYQWLPSDFILVRWYMSSFDTFLGTEVLGIASAWKQDFSILSQILWKENIIGVIIKCLEYIIYMPHSKDLYQYFDVVAGLNICKERGLGKPTRTYMALKWSCALKWYWWNDTENTNALKWYMTWNDDAWHEMIPDREVADEK